LKNWSKKVLAKTRNPPRIIQALDITVHHRHGKNIYRKWIRTQMATIIVNQPVWFGAPFVGDSGTIGQTLSKALELFCSKR
jgi:hypothetical protein